MRLRFVLKLAALLMLVSALCLAQGRGNGNGQGKGHGNPHAAANDSSSDRGPVFTTRQQQTIRNYFRSPYANLPPGLAKRGGNLPPGLQKQVDRNGTLPPGLQKRVQPFPPDLEARLPRLPRDYERGVIGNDIIIRNTKTQRIVDIVRDVLIPPAE